MSQLAIAFDYGSLDVGTRVMVEDARDRIKYLERRTSEGLIEIGRHLSAVKDALPHGKFGPWIESEFGWSDRTAQRFIQVAEAFQNRQIVGIAPSALYALASGTVPDEVREDFIAKAEAGERITHRDVQAVIHPRPEPEPDDTPTSTQIRAVVNDRLVDLETGEIVDPALLIERAREQAASDPLADMPTAHEYAAREKAARKWLTSFDDILVNVNSVKHHGGIAVTTRGWSPTRRAELQQRIERLIELLSAVRDDLEEMSDAA